jgi:NAD(P)H-nitrite reductase large subunit
MAGDMTLERLLQRYSNLYEQRQIEFKLDVLAQRLDPASRRVHLMSGESLDYDRLLLCTGAIARELQCPGTRLPGVRYLRNLADVAAIQAGLSDWGPSCHHRRRLHGARDSSNRALTGV